MAGNDIKHKGVVRKVTDATYLISVERTAACIGCAAKKYCNLSDDEDELITVKREPSQTYREGDSVSVVLTERLGRSAVIFGYLIPCIVLLVGIILPILCGLSQGMGGIIGVGNIVLYYAVLALFRKKLDRKFVFRIE